MCLISAFINFRTSSHVTFFFIYVIINMSFINSLSTSSNGAPGIQGLPGIPGIQGNDGDDGERGPWSGGS